MGILKNFVAVSITSLSLSLLLYVYGTVSTAQVNMDDMLWKQSVEAGFKEDVEAYQDKMNKRYSRMDRDMSSYQLMVNRRLGQLERSINESEDSNGCKQTDEVHQSSEQVQ
jgi:hypothetical protein